MKDDIRRIMKLVEEGKLSADDAVELIEAFENQPKAEEPAEPEYAGTSGSATPPPPPPPPGSAAKGDDPLSQIVDAIEKIGRGVANSVNWKEVAEQTKSGAMKGVEALKKTAAEVRKGNFPFFGTHVTREVTMSFDAPSGKTLRIENAVGDIKISSGFDKSSIKATAKVHGTDRDDAQRKADIYTLIVEESDSVVLIKQPDMSGLAVDLEIELSSEPMIEIKGQQGDVDLNGAPGGARVALKSGDVSIDQAKGLVEIQNSAGDFSCSDSTLHTLTLEQKSGDVTLHGVKGNINLRCAAGDISLTNCSGQSISLEAVSGDIKADLDQPVTGSVNIRAVNGDVRVDVPDGCDARVMLSTLRGDVACGLALDDEVSTEQRITGHLGAKTGSIDISAVNGDVHLDQRKI